MRRTLFALFVVTAPTLAAQTRRPDPPHAAAAAVADTVKMGKYEIEVTTDDGTMVGELVVSRPHGLLTATINAGGGRVPAVKSFVKNGNEYVLTGGHEAFEIVYTFTFARDSLKGAFTGSGGLAGTVLGAFKK